MSDEVTERDVEALAASLRTMWFGHTCREVAQMLLDSGWFAEAIAEAEQRGREDNADHGMCYVSGSKALAARDAVARREALTEAANAADATGDPEQGPVYVASDWLRKRALRGDS